MLVQIIRICCHKKVTLFTSCDIAALLWKSSSTLQSGDKVSVQPYNSVRAIHDVCKDIKCLLR